MVWPHEGEVGRTRQVNKLQQAALCQPERKQTGGEGGWGIKRKATATTLIADKTAQLWRLKVKHIYGGEGRWQGGGSFSKGPGRPALA